MWPDTRRMSTWSLGLTTVLILQVLGIGPPLQARETAAAPLFNARVTHIVDGDTLDVVHDRSTQRIRLEGIDCPEAGQPYARVATAFSRRSVLDRQVQIVPRSVDRYGRLVARVIVDNRDLSRELLKAGLAWHYTAYSSDADLATLEQQARASHLGLWADAAPVPPWVARRRPRSPRIGSGSPAPRTRAGR